MNEEEKLRDQLRSLYWRINEMQLDLEKFMEADTRHRTRLMLEKARAEHRERLGDLCGTPIDDLNLTVRSHNVLTSNNIHTVEQLVKHTERDLFKMENMGRKSINEVKEVLASMNLKLKEDA